MYIVQLIFSKVLIKTFLLVVILYKMYNIIQKRCCLIDKSKFVLKVLKWLILDLSSNAKPIYMSVSKV